MGLEKIQPKNPATQDGRALSRAVEEDSSESEEENNMAGNVNNFLEEGEVEKEEDWIEKFSTDNVVNEETGKPINEKFAALLEKILKTRMPEKKSKNDVRCYPKAFQCPSATES